MPEVPAVAEVVRSGFVEGHHYGSVVVLAEDGSVDWSIGDVASPMLPRSSNKPLQALGMLRAGLELEGELLALAAASHSGEAFHVEGVRRILAAAGLDESALQNTPLLPLDEVEKEEVLRAGGSKSSIQADCSGKHAAMLATCVVNEWDTSTYLSVEHPLQVAIRETFEELTGEPVAAVAVDGCGAPLLSASLTALASAFRRLALATSGPEARVANAFRAHPEWASGTRRDEVTLHRAVPGLVAKVGAEAVYAAGLPDGRAVALKIDDGGVRARAVVMAAVLERMGVHRMPGVDADALRETGRHVILGGGQPVGEIRAVLS